jgi:DHA1 family bicyclomycin/chloramphenicol resistance-like MFS transporter
MTIPNATAGMLSVRPDLAGTASGLGSSVMIGGGAALSALAGIMLRPDNGALVLNTIMATSVAIGLICILYVMRRNRILNTP